jgi:hypothetical protein
MQEILDKPETPEMPMWCRVNALSEAEFANLQCSKVFLFTYSFANCDNATVQRAVLTIEEHHLRARVWVKGVVLRLNCAVSECLQWVKFSLS